MPVMFVVSVKMHVFRRLMPVFVLVPFRQVQPDAQSHQHRRHDGADRESVPQKQNRDNRARERRDGKVSAGPCRSNMPQREHE